MDGKVIAPQVVDQPVRRYRPPEVQQEISEQRADLDLGNRDQPAVFCPHRQGSEQAETHQVRIARPPAVGRQPTDSQPPQGGVRTADA
jgi:hypothetical protein